MRVIPKHIRSPYLWLRVTTIAAEQSLCEQTGATLYSLAETRFFGQRMRLRDVIFMAGYDALMYRIKRGAS